MVVAKLSQSMDVLTGTSVVGVDMIMEKKIIILWVI
jgi:hypothetical protein